MRSKKIFKIILHSIGPLIFLYIISQINFTALADSLKSVNLPLLFLAAAVMILEVIIRSKRWQKILSALSLRISGRQSLELYWVGAFVGVITPGKLGELIKVYFLKRKGYSSFRSFFSVFLDRLIDIIFLFFIGLLIFLFCLQSIGIYIFYFGLLICLLLGVFLLFFSRKIRLPKRWIACVKKIIPWDLSAYDRFTFAKLRRGIKGLKPADVIFTVIYLLLGWLLYFLSRYMIATSLGLHLSFVSIAIISSAVAIVSALPFSIAGLGTREAVVIYFFSLFGLKAEIALVFSLLILATDLLVVSLGLIPYFNESKLISQTKASEI